MTCLNPRNAWELHNKAEDTTIIRFSCPNYNPLMIVTPIVLPCKTCLSCRLDYSREWAIRCVHEASLHYENSFLTLTYDNEHLPDDQSVSPEEHKLFMYRLREYLPGRPIRFYMCAEYGDKKSRAHYHYLIFGWTPPDQVHQQTNNGNKIYRSETLARLWARGFVTVGNVSFQSAGYVARYVVKKHDPNQEADLYWHNPNTGEWYDKTPEFNRMSTGHRSDGLGGIGKGWITTPSNLEDTFRDDYIVHEGHKMPVPGYYNKILEESDPDRYAEVKEKRKEHALDNEANQTPERLAVRRTVLAARVKSLKRA